MFSYFKLDQAAKREFYQAKYDYFKQFVLGTLGASSLVYFLMMFTDWQLAGSLSILHILMRGMVIIPFGIMVLFYRKSSDYRLMTLVAFLMIHAIIWGNIWIMSLLPDQSFANAGFLMMSFFLLMISFGTPPTMAMIGQAGLIADILLANHIFEYPDINIILASNWSIIVLFFFVDLIGTRYFYDSYLLSKKLDFALLHDPLTQVFNRRKLDDLMGPSHDLSFMSPQIGLLIMDIDHFKLVNDTYGHDNGDRILQFTADCIKNSLRDNDLVIRWGGEEFTAILFDCPTEQIRLTAERIRATIEQSDNGVCPVTISIGTKFYSGDDCIKEIKLADQALYAAKNGGRNRVVAYEEIQDSACEKD